MVLICSQGQDAQVRDFSGGPVVKNPPCWDAWDKCSGLVHWEDPEEWGGEGGGREDQDGEYM